MKTMNRMRMQECCCCEMMAMTMMKEGIYIRYKQNKKEAI